MDTQRLSSDLAAIVGDEGVISRADQLVMYDCDAYTIEKALPTVVVLPTSTDHVSAICRLAHRAGLPVIPRGAGTGLSGGALAVEGGIIISLTRMNRILEIDIPNRFVRAQTGVVNASITKAVRSTSPPLFSSDSGNNPTMSKLSEPEKGGGLGGGSSDFFFAPDPSSQGACTIGGNIAENSGGPHTLRYGVTANHVTGLTLVLPDGTVEELGGPEREPFGYDLVGIVVGSEGTFGIVTEATCRILRKPEAVVTLLASFPSVESATQAVTAVIAEGLQPAALEMMDRPVLEAVEMAFGYGLARGAEAALIVEFEGCAPFVQEASQQGDAICRAEGAFAVLSATEDLERAKLWAARKKAIGALGHITPSVVTHDGVIPRSKLPSVLAQCADIARRHGLRNANVFHAGDGNLHPVLMFDDTDPEQVRAVVAAGEEILNTCLAAGGSLTGEHGIGIEKATMLDRMFDADTIDCMRRLKTVFNPDGRCNPGKIFPDSKHCYEMKPRRGPIGV